MSSDKEIGTDKDADQTGADYQAALDYLYSFVDYSLTRSQFLSPDKFDLGRMFRLMEALGNPQFSYPSIHIAGSKGKGSVAAMCASALRSAGYRVGLYTSPHLHDYCERIQVDGQAIDHAELVNLLNEIKSTVASIPELTTFEITTALGFLYFSRQKVTAAVIEVGLGGRLDATNVIVPVVSVITSLSLDHTAVLGDTLAKIAFEKAGIVKPGVPVVLSPQEEEARQVVEAVAAERNSPFGQVGGFAQDYAFASQSHSLDAGQSLTVWHSEKAGELDGPEAPAARVMRLTIPLLGEHQVVNAATAFAALQVFESRGFPIGEDAILAGFHQVKWPGRFEIIRREPLLIVDSAHNRDSACKLRKTLDEYFPDHAVVLVFGASEDKDVEGMFTELLPRVEKLIVTRSFHPRAFEPVLLAEIAGRFGRNAVIIEKVEQAAMDAVSMVESMGIGGIMVLAAGSLFIAAAARETWLAQVSEGIDHRLEI